MRAAPSETLPATGPPAVGRGRGNAAAVVEVVPATPTWRRVSSGYAGGGEQSVKMS